MAERVSKFNGSLVHTCPLKVRGGGEMNINWMMQTTRDDVNWKAFGIDCPENKYHRSFIPPGVPYIEMGQTPHNLPSVSDIRTIKRAAEGDTPIIFTANDLRTLGLLVFSRVTAGDNVYYLWQSVPKRPDVKNIKRRAAIEAINLMAAHIAPHHLTFSEECRSELTGLGVDVGRINLIPQLLNTDCDRGLREDRRGGRDPVRDALRILIISRVTKTKGIHKLPEYLRALDAQLNHEGVRMSVALMGNASHGAESAAILDELNGVAPGLKNVSFAYLGYQPPQVVYSRMAESDMALSLAGTEGYSVSFIEGLNMGLPHAVQSICAPNVDVIKRSGSGWILTGDPQQDAEQLARLRYDTPGLLSRRESGYAFVDGTTGQERFRNEFLNAVFRHA